jgi:hypothetical protein
VVDASEVRTVIRRFKCGSSGGPDGLRPIHLRDLTAEVLGEAGVKLLDALTSVINIMLSGSVPDEICPFIYGANLIALGKKSGGIRPIAIGYVFRRIAAKLACGSIIDEVRPYLQPHQMGFGSPGGAEAIHRASRIFVAANQGVFLKLDCHNAFNSVYRQAVLEAALERVPALFPFIVQCYTSPSHLLFGDFVISSEEGVQQGDPLGPVLYCLVTQPIIQDLTSTLNAAFLDDESLGDAASVVASDLEKVLIRSAAIGLELNPTKCELYVMEEQDTEGVAKICRLLPGVKILEGRDCELLGAPLTNDALPQVLDRKVNEIQLLSSRLPLLKSHVAVLLLRCCLSIPKMTYLLRCCPSWKAPDQLARFDAVIRDTLDSLLNCSLDDQTWAQASLPVARGGLGLRSAQNLSPTAFLASFASTAELVTTILGSPQDDPDRQEALDHWLALSNNAPVPSSVFQRDWDQPILDQLTASVLANARSPKDKARILASHRKESGGWLQTLPSPNLGTLLDDIQVSISAKVRLGLPICHPHICFRCKDPADSSGLHGLSCPQAAPVGRNARHQMLNDILRRACATANIPAILEPDGICRDDGKKPDGLTLIPWSKGKCLLWDATCVDTMASSYINSTSHSAGAAANSRELAKRRKYSGLSRLYIFVPFGVETMGPFGGEALELVSDLGRRLQEATKEPRAKSYLIQRISIAIQRGNAACILSTIPPSLKLSEIYTL